MLINFNVRDEYLDYWKSAYNCHHVSFKSGKFLFKSMILDSELLGFRTLSIVRYSKDWKTQRFGNWVCLVSSFT
jgi:hypothetical protein